MDDYYDDFLEQSVIDDEIEEIDDCEANGDDDNSITSYKNDGFEMPSSIINNDSNLDNQSSSSLYKNDFFELFESDENSMLLFGNPIDNLLEIKDMDGIIIGGKSIYHKPTKTTKKKHGGSSTSGISSEMYTPNLVNTYNKLLPSKKIITSAITNKSKYSKNNPESSINRSTPSSSKRKNCSNGLDNNQQDINNKQQQPLSSSSSGTKPNTIVHHHHAPGLLHKQLAMAMNQVSMYRKENAMLRQKLDVIGIDEAIMKYKTLLIEKENKISDLFSENLALKEISRYQAKYLENEKIKSHEPENYILTQENQIEVLMIHIKKLKGKLTNMKTNQDQLIIEIELLKKRNNRLICSNNKLRRKNKQLIANNTIESSEMMDDKDRQEVKESLKHKLYELNSDSIISKSKQQSILNYTSSITAAAPVTVLEMNIKNMKNFENIQNQIISNETIANILMKEEIKLLNKKIKELTKKNHDEIQEFKIKLEVMSEEKESFRQKLYLSEENILKIRGEYYNLMEQNKKSVKENKQRLVKKESMQGGRTYPSSVSTNNTNNNTNVSNPILHEDDSNTIADSTNNTIADDLGNKNSTINNSINNTTTITNGNSITVINNNNPQPPPMPAKKTIKSVRGTKYTLKLT